MRTLSCSPWDPVPDQGWNSGPSTLRAWTLSRWTTREVLKPELLVSPPCHRRIPAWAHPDAECDVEALLRRLEEAGGKACEPPMAGAEQTLQVPTHWEAQGPPGSSLPCHQSPLSSTHTSQMRKDNDGAEGGDGWRDGRLQQAGNRMDRP